MKQWRSLNWLGKLKLILCRFTTVIEFCGKCGRRVDQVWTAPDPLWLALNDGREGGVFCIRCFDKRAEALGWMLRWVPRLEHVRRAQPRPETVERTIEMARSLGANADTLSVLEQVQRESLVVAGSLPPRFPIVMCALLALSLAACSGSRPAPKPPNVPNIGTPSPILSPTLAPEPPASPRPPSPEPSKEPGNDGAKPGERVTVCHVERAAAGDRLQLPLTLSRERADWHLEHHDRDYGGKCKEPE